MNDEIYGGVRGEKLGERRVDQRLVTAAEREEASRYYPELDFSEFAVVESAPGKPLLVHESGAEYRPVSHLVLPSAGGSPSPLLNIEGFVVDDGGKLHFLRRRGQEATPTNVVYHGGSRGAKLS